MTQITSLYIYAEPRENLFYVFWTLGPLVAIISSAYILFLHIPRCLEVSKKVRNLPIADNATIATTRVLQTIPVFGITGAIATWWPESTYTCQFIQSVSISVGFVNYCHLLIYLLGGVENALSSWALLPPKAIWAPLPLTPLRCCTPKTTLGDRALKQIWFWSYQYIIIAPFMSFMEVAVNELFRSEVVDDAKLFLSTVQIISTCACMYHVAVLRDVCVELKGLEAHNIVAKFTVIYCIIIFAKILGLCLIEFLPSKHLENGFRLTGNEHGSLWTNFICCITVGFMGVLAKKAFPVSECEVYAMMEDDRQNPEGSFEGSSKSVTFANARMDSTLIPHMRSSSYASSFYSTRDDIVGEFLLSNDGRGRQTQEMLGANSLPSKMPLLKRLQTVE